MPTFVKVGGVWTRVGAPFARVGGVWRSGTWFVKAGGVWKNVSIAPPADLSYTGGFEDDSGGFVTLQYTGFSDGAVYPTIGSLSPQTFTDSTGTTRTINAMISSHFFDSLDMITDDSSAIYMSGTVPDDNDSWQRIVINGATTILRANGGYSVSGGYSIWTYPGLLFGFGGPVTCRVLFDASQS